jgi:fibronectin type 3 domain-containing protein
VRAGGLALLLALAAATACGKVGPPVAPETRLPQPVTDLQAVVEDGGVVLTWTNPIRRVDNSLLRDLQTARVYRSEDDGRGEPRTALLRRGRIAGWDEVKAIDLEPTGTARASRGQQLRVEDREGLVPARRYSYVVLTEDTQGRVSVPSSRVSVTLIAAPEPPPGLTAVAGEQEVRLTWAAPTRLADGSPVPGPLTYEVLRAAEAQTPGQAVTPAPIEATSFVDRSVENDRTYHYSVRAVLTDADTLSRGAPTASVEATPRDMTPPAPPASLVAIPADDSVRLSWRASPDADVASYVVYRARAGEAFTRVGSTFPDRTSYIDSGVAPGTYRYAVTALDSGAQPNESARSNIVTVTPGPRSR